jgi:hypothetical protein
VAVMVGASLIAAHTVSLMRCRSARECFRFEGARRGFMAGQVATMPMIHFTNSRRPAGGTARSTSGPCSMTFTKLGGQTSRSSSTKRCGRCCWTRNVCSRFGRERHCRQIAEKMIMRRLPCQRQIARRITFKSHHHRSSSPKLSKRLARHRHMLRRMLLKSRHPLWSRHAEGVTTRGHARKFSLIAVSAFQNDGRSP